MDISKQIKKLENRLSISAVETPVQRIVRKQECLIFFYSHKDASQAEMESFSKRNSQTPEQYANNLATFARLVDEATNGRKFNSVQWGLR